MNDRRHTNERPDHFFEEVLTASDGTEYDVTIWYKVKPAIPRQQVMKPYPLVMEVILNDGGEQLPVAAYDELEDEIYKCAERHLRNLPSREDIQ